MGELFRWKQPENGLAWTGERFVSAIDGNGQIEIEHLHRYFLAREFCRGKSILDVASGEGYGSSILAQTAERVVGVELDPVSVEHASAAYQLRNLQFLQGEATSLPVESGSIDVVVSFETLEHFADHESFLAEVKRVLRPDGSLVISTPDARVYSGPHSTPNPFHIRELTDSEFLSELGAVFSKVTLFRQQAILGSAILPDGGDGANEVTVFERRDASTFEASQLLQRAPYLVAVATNGGTARMSASVYLHSDKLPLPEEHTRAAQEAAVKMATDEGLIRLTQAEEKFREHAAAAQQECAREQAELMAAQAEAMRQLGECQAHLGQTRQDLAQERERFAEATKKLKEGDDLLADARNKLLEPLYEKEAIEQQANNKTLLIRQQELAVRRLQRDLVHKSTNLLELQVAQERLSEAHLEVANLRSQLAEVGSELTGAQVELASLRAAYQQVCNLLIPIRLRQSVPGFLKSPLRNVKRALRNG